jgi:Holliday junction resolvase-like predicted endonuclease
MERLAVRLLRQAGWKIIDVRSMQFEGSRFIDIVARYGSELGNFEVKLNSCRYIARQFFIDPVRELFGTRCRHVPRRYGTARPRATTAR